MKTRGRPQKYSYSAAELRAQYTRIWPGCSSEVMQKGVTVDHIYKAVTERKRIPAMLRDGEITLVTKSHFTFTTKNGVDEVEYREVDESEISEEDTKDTEDIEDTENREVTELNYDTDDGVPTVERTRNTKSTDVLLAQLIQVTTANKLTYADVDKIAQRVSRTEAYAIVRDYVRDNPVKPQEVRITVNSLPTVTVEKQHRLFPILVALVAARVPVMLVGEAASSKSSAAHSAANIAGLNFYKNSIGPQTSKSDIVGFIHAQGDYVTTPAREAAENGGVWLCDEIDAGNPGVLTIMNGLLDNSLAAFPDKPEGIVKHKDFVVVSTANTYGTGASRQYVGRNPLDAATLDRFFQLEWPIDEDFEREICGIPVSRQYAECKSSGLSVEEWVDYVQKIRRICAEKNILHLVSPRASIYGCKLLDVLDRQTIEEGLIWKGLTDIQRQQIKGAM